MTLLQSAGPLTLAADVLQPCFQPTGFSLDRGAAWNFSSALFGFLFDDSFFSGARSPFDWNFLCA
jgi:hypothetical protein